MLIPFDRNVLYIQQLPGKYVFSVLNDLFRYEKDISGYLCCVGQGIMGYLFFKNSKLLGAVAFQVTGGGGMPQPVSFRLLLEDDNIDVYANVMEETSILEAIYRFFASACVLHAPFEMTDMKRLTTLLSDVLFSGMVGFQQGMVINMAFYDRGRFRYFLYYHPDTKSYAYENDHVVFMRYLELLPKLVPVITVHDFRMKTAAEGINDIVIAQQKDIVVNLLLGYFDVFDFIIHMLLEFLTPVEMERHIGIIFDELRQKYDPLYRTIRFSPETLTVNWMDILEDRKYIPLQYRFEHYHLYIDEIWKRLFALLAEKGGATAVGSLREKIAKYLALVDKDERELKKMLYRLEQQCGATG